MNYCILIPFLILAVFNAPIKQSSTIATGTGGGRHDVAEEKYLDLANNKQFDCVGLVKNNGTPSGTCVLISKQWVLTAGHVLIDKNKKDISVVFNDKEYAVDTIIIHEKYMKGKIGHDVDLCMIKLSRLVETIAPASLYLLRKEIGQTGTIVGYGSWGRGKDVITKPTSVGIKRAGQNIIDQLGGKVGEREFPNNLLIADFDHPDKPAFSKTGSGTAIALEYCPVGGDSGGGLFINVNGKELLAGILSAFSAEINDDIEDGIYGSVSYWIRVNDYAEWISKMSEI